MDLFGTAGIRGAVADDVTPELALAVGRAVAADAVGTGSDEPPGAAASGNAVGATSDEPPGAAASGGAAEVVVGRDGRTTGEGLAAAVAAGLLAGGADVRLAGAVPTPALAFASRGRHGVMLTASHNPPHDNGIKLFADGQEYDREAERRIDERVAASGDEGDRPDRLAAGTPQARWDDWGERQRVDPLADYRTAVAEYAADQSVAASHPTASGGDGDPASLSVAVDAGNGVGSLATPHVLADLGTDVTALNASVDGHFPARESKPTAESLADARAFVAAGDFDVGFAHDGDADRLVVLDGDGEVVHEDTVLAVLAEHYVRHSDAVDPVVVTTPNASGRIDERVDAAGGRVERVRLGALHEGIARERRAGGEETAVVFAAEPWKHVHTAFGGWIDGVVGAAVLANLVADAGGLAPLREPVAERPYRKVSVDCPEALKGPAMDRITETLPAAFEDGDVDTDYGVRVDLPDGSWVLVRPSGTEPYVRVYAESDEVDDLVGTAVDLVERSVEAAA